MKTRQILIAILILATLWHPAQPSRRKRTSTQLRLRRKAFWRVQACKKMLRSPIRLRSKPEMPLGPTRRSQILRNRHGDGGGARHPTDFSVIVQARRIELSTNRQNIFCSRATKWQ